MGEPLHLILDTNVVFKWYVTERESLLGEARTLREAFLDNRLDLGGPDILRYELAELLRRAARDGRLPVAAAVSAYGQFDSLRIPLEDTRALVTRALGLALTLGVSVFDTLFLLVAEQTGFALVTEDGQLVRAAVGTAAQVVHLGDYNLT